MAQKPSAPIGAELAAREAALKPQALKVLRMLRAGGERGVTNGDFIRSYIERFGGRICEMRKLGWQIDTVREGPGRCRYILRAEPSELDATEPSSQGAEEREERSLDGSGGVELGRNGAAIERADVGRGNSPAAYPAIRPASAALDGGEPQLFDDGAFRGGRTYASEEI